MKLITRDTDYAIRALRFIARSKKARISVSDLVKEIDIPKAFLRKILQALSRGGFLKSYKGQGGGFSLTLSSDKITLLDLIEAFQGRIKFNDCVFKKVVCRNIKKCKVKRKIDNIQNYVTQELKSVTLRSLL